MPSRAATNTATVNWRIPLSLPMEAMITRLRRVGAIPCSSLRKGNSKTVDALLDRGYVVVSGDERYSLTSAGDEIAKALADEEGPSFKKLTRKQESRVMNAL
jgi:hypothetical protein